MNQRDSKSVLQATLGETYSLYEGLEKEGLRVTTIEDSFLTIEGLIRGVDTYPAHLPGDEPQQGRNFSVYVNNGIIPLMTRYEGDNPVFTFGIVTHKVDGKTKKLQESDAVLVSLDDLFKITDFYSKNDKKVRYVLLSLEQAQEILSNELLSNQTARRKYLKGIEPLVYNAVKSLIADKTSIDELLRVAITEDEFLRRGKMIGQSLTKYVNKIAELRDKK